MIKDGFYTPPEICHPGLDLAKENMSVVYSLGMMAIELGFINSIKTSETDYFKAFSDIRSS